MTNKQELAKTSAQDQFAKWAKLRRSVDKNLSELEKLSTSLLSLLSSLSSTHSLPSPLVARFFLLPFPCLNRFTTTDSKLSSGKTTFTVGFRIFLWIFVNIPQYAIAWRYRSQGVFQLPQGWFNPVATWWLAFPFTPRGSVSVMTWTWACKAVLRVGEECVRFVLCECFLFCLFLIGHN
jgi:hypothetical protein